MPTISEKILAEKSGRKKVSAGEIVEARVDYVMLNDVTGLPAFEAFKRFKAEPKKEKTVLIPDHYVPNKDIASAEQARAMRNFALEHGIKNYFEVGRGGVCHQLMIEHGFVAPGRLIVGADSHTCSYGALGCFATGIGSSEAAAAMALGSLWFKVPETQKFVVEGKLGKWVMGKDIILHAIGDRRFLLHKDTILELIEKNVKLVIIAHQGRPGEADFTTLEKHAHRLSEVIGHEVRYVDSLTSSFVCDTINEMKGGEVILLENTRFYSEEVLKRPPDVQAKTILVEKLSPLFDVFVLDGFSVSHRSQPSVVGFPMVMQGVAGRLLEKEVKTILGAVENPKLPVTFVLGGTKADDSVKVAKRALKTNDCKILTGGVVGNIFLAAKGYRLGEPTHEFIRGKGLIEQIKVARKLIKEYEDNILIPLDVAIDKDGKREEIPVGDLPQNYKISDVGKETVKEYTQIIKESGTIFANGALGIFEDEKFSYGTERIIKAIADSKGFSIIGGGHTVAAAHQAKVGDKIDHISSGGKACMTLLIGESLAGIEVLRKVK